MRKEEIKALLKENKDLGIVWSLERDSESPNSLRKGYKTYLNSMDPIYQCFTMESVYEKGRSELWPLGLPSTPSKERQARLQERINTIVMDNMPEGLGRMMSHNPLNIVSEEMTIIPASPRDVFLLYRFLGGMDYFKEFEDRFFRVGKLFYGKEGPMKKTLSELMDFGKANEDLVEEMMFGRTTMF